MIYSLCSQGWYIGITAASQAVKAGSTPVPCSKKSPRRKSWTFFGFRGTSKCSAEVNSACANAFAQQKHFTAWVGMPVLDGGARRCCPDGQCAMGGSLSDDGDCAALRRGDGVGRSACADWWCAALLPLCGKARWSSGAAHVFACGVDVADIIARQLVE